MNVASRRDAYQSRLEDIDGDIPDDITQPAIMVTSPNSSLVVGTKYAESPISQKQLEMLLSNNRQIITN